MFSLHFEVLSFLNTGGKFLSQCCLTCRSRPSLYADVPSPSSPSPSPILVLKVSIKKNVACVESVSVQKVAEKRRPMKVVFEIKNNSRLGFEDIQDNHI